MNDKDLFWWCSAHLRISHPNLDRDEVSRNLNATPAVVKLRKQTGIADPNSQSTGLWCVEHRVESPERPDSLIAWAEEFVHDRQSKIKTMLADDFDIDVYIGIHSNVLALGFDLPPTPVLTKLNIRIGIEFFAK